MVGGGGYVYADGERIREGVRSRAYLNAGHDQQSRHPLRRPGQDGGGGGGDVRTGAERMREGSRKDHPRTQKVARSLRGLHARK